MDQILCPSWRKKKMETKFSISPHFLGNQTESQQVEPQKNENFLHNFSSTLFHCKKKNEIFIFFQLSHTFSVTKHNHTTKNNHKTYRKNQRQWSLKSPLQFLPTGVEVRISPP